MNFYEELCKTAGLSSKNLLIPMFSKHLKYFVDNELKVMSLKKPFVFITVAAQSNGSMSSAFWRELSFELANRGYEIFFNEPQSFIGSLPYKNVFYTVAEAKYLAEHADIIVGIRSGLMDVIANDRSKIFCIYKPFLDRGLGLPALSAQKVLDAFSLKYLPYANRKNIYEYNAELDKEDVILHKILHEVD